MTSIWKISNLPFLTEKAGNTTHMFKPKGPYCQSCGMPLSKDEHQGGTEKDDSKSQDYCSHCYQHGSFTDPHITLEAMKLKVEGKMKTLHIPKFLARMFTKNMSELKRWR